MEMERERRERKDMEPLEKKTEALRRLGGLITAFVFMQERCWSLISYKVTAFLSIFLNSRKTLLWLLPNAISPGTGWTKNICF